MRKIKTSIRKSDYVSLTGGKAVYTDDLAPDSALIIKMVRSPHAHAIVKSVKTDIAKKLPGIECVLTHEDVPNERFTPAGQTYPEMSPYDHLILDKHIRYLGEPVVIIAGTKEHFVNQAIKTIRVEYEVLEPIIDLHDAIDNPSIIHDEDNYFTNFDVGADPKRNIASSKVDTYGDYDEVLKECDVVLTRTYHSKANNQAMMETFQTSAQIDSYGRLCITSSTQIPFHVRRIVSTALGIPKSKIRVIKPRIGGGFGAKQTAVSELYPALVTHVTGKPSKMIYTREEAFVAGSPRHEMEITLTYGAMKDGTLRCVNMYALSNNGAYGDHAATTVGLTMSKALSVYSRIDAYIWAFDVVYTNRTAAGAFRGYGATQGCYAIESMMNELAHELDMDPTRLREINMVKEGDIVPSYHNEEIQSCALDRCLIKAKEMAKWDEGYKNIDMGNGKVRGKGIACAMQGSGVKGVDVGSATLQVNDDGFYTLHVGSADMGTGSDTTLAQIAAEILDCEASQIVVVSADTDTSPYDSGSYASSTMYVTGNAVLKTAEKLREVMIEAVANLLEDEVEAIDFDGVTFTGSKDTITLKNLVTQMQKGNHSTALQVTESHSSPMSPPPYMVGIAEVEVDLHTGQVSLIDYVGVVDCGVAINPNICRVQAEGGIVQGIGMALYEDVTYGKLGNLEQNSFMQYNIPSRIDLPNIRVAFEESHEPTGPFGAKSIGEVVINTPSPAIADAIFHACGVRLRELPMFGEHVFKELQKKKI